MQINEKTEIGDDLDLDLELLENLVNISSQSRDTDGVNSVQNLLEKNFSELGLKTYRVKNSDYESGELLVAERKGVTPFINLICHADTVLPVSKSHFFKMSECKKKLHGPGIADNKGGIIVLLKALKKYINNCESQFLSLRVVVSPNEELGSNGFHEHFKRFGLESRYSFGFEPSLENGDIIHSRNGNLWFELELQGESFHSGRAPKGHMNSAFDLARILASIDEKAYEREDITINIGELSGGHSFNTIASEAKAKIDARFRNFEGLAFVKKIVEQDFESFKRVCSKNKKSSKLEINIADFCPPLSSIEGEHEIQKYYIDHFNLINSTTIKSVHCGGAADVNHFSHPELYALDGLGPIGGNMHRLDEWIDLNSLESKSSAFYNLLCFIEQKESKHEHH